MVVLFDIYMQYPDIKDLVRKDVDLISFLKGITEFIFVRLDPLREEIDKEELEEQNNEHKKRAIIVWLLLEKNNQITFEGYSDKLKNKMLSCFSKSDIEYFVTKMKELQQMRNN